MGEWKTIVGAVAVGLTFLGYVPYVRDVLSGKTVPHIFSWFLWAFVTGIAFALQVSDNAGPGAYVTLAAALLCLVVLGLGLRMKGKRDIVLMDTIFLLLAFVALGLWLIADQPLLSAVLVTAVDVLGFIPTVRKSWHKPYSETLSFYVLNSFRFFLAAVALQRYTVITALYPISWLFINGLFAVMLIWRRKLVEVSIAG